MYRFVFILSVIAFASLTGGCASVVKGTSQQVSVVTPGVEGAMCELRSPDGTYYVNSTPGTVTISKSKHNMAVTCEKEGYDKGFTSASSNFEGMTFGNIIVGGIIGVGVDAASGAMFDYPNAIQVHMKKKLAEPVTPQVPAAASSEEEAAPSTPIS